MKIRIITIALLCILLISCTNGKNLPEQPIESAQLETIAAETDLIIPLPDTTMDALENSIVNISFTPEDFHQDEFGKISLRMKIHSYDKFDMVDIADLESGDRILILGEEIPVNTVERNDYGTVLINGGLDAGGLDLATNDGGIYFLHGYSDMKSWYLLGEVEYPVSDEFVFTDSADLDLGSVTYSVEELLSGIPVSIYGYEPQNTTVRIENGQVVAMDRIYTP